LDSEISIFASDTFGSMTGGSMRRGRSDHLDRQ
jgi:hypothetical protein